MPRVTFTKDYDFRPKPGVVIAYKAGWTGLVVTPCAERALAEGKAKRINVKPRAEKPAGTEDEQA